MGAYYNQVINAVLACVHLTVGSVGAWIHSVVIFPDSEWIVEIDILSNWQNSYIGSLTCGVKIVMIERDREAVELPLATKVIKLNKQTQFWSDCRDYEPDQGLEICKTVILTSPSSTHLFGLCRKQYSSLSHLRALSSFWFFVLI